MPTAPSPVAKATPLPLCPARLRPKRAAAAAAAAAKDEVGEVLGFTHDKALTLH